MSDLKLLLKNKFLIKTLQAEAESFREVTEAFVKLNKIKTLNKTKTANKFNADLIKELRKKIKNTDLYARVLCHRGKNIESYILIQDQLSYNLKLKDRKELFLNAYSTYVKEKKANRIKERSSLPILKTELGFKYSMIGETFDKPGQILALQSIDSQKSRIKLAKSPAKDSKKNYIGVELELVCRVDRSILEQKFCESYLGGYVYVKHDGSIQTENTGDFVHEVTVLCPESMYESIITRVCEVLNRKQIGGYVNNSCGLHVHYDARNRIVEKMFHNMVSILPLATKMVPKNRLISSHAQQYCKLNKHKLFAEQRKLNDRYTAINANSYSSHNTIEVRLHSGTLNPVKINCWIKTFLNAINHPETLDADIESVSRYAAVFGIDTKLNDYMIKRIKLFEERGDAIDTRADHHLFNDVIAV
jgi:Putative amidoligase enzyme